MIDSLRKISDTELMLRKLKAFGLNTFYRVIWASLLSVLTSFTIILLARLVGATQISLDYFVQKNFAALFPFFFVMWFSILFSIYLMSIVSKLPEPRIFSLLEKRLKSASIETRRSVAEFSKWASICSFLIALVIFFLTIHENIVNPGFQSSYLAIWFFIIYFLSLFLFSNARFIMNNVDWTIYHLKRFRKTKASKDLENALKNYNKILASSLSFKKLLAISQYVAEAFKVLNPKDSEKLDQQIGNIINCLETKNIGKADDALIELSRASMEFIKEHEQILGFEVKYPYMLRFLEQAKALLVKVFPQFMLFLIWIALIIILTRFGIIPISFPP